MDWDKKISRKDFLKILFSVGLGVFFGSLIYKFFEEDSSEKRENIGYGSMPYGGTKN